MPSQEDYLDDLLNGTSEEDGDILAWDGGMGQAPGLDALADMSEEQISQLLAQGEAGASPSPKETAEDVLDLQGGSSDSDLQEIQDMLKKSDRNEAVGTLENAQSGESPADRLLSDIESAGETEAAESAEDQKNRKAQEKKRLKEEKKAAREAAKAAKKEKRRGKKKNGGEGDVQAAQSESRPKDDGVKEYDMLLDRQLLDSIVSEAGKVEHAEPARQEEESADLMEFAASLDAERNIDPSQETPYLEENEAMGTGMDSGILALEPDEIDNLIPDISESGQEEAAPKKKGMLSKFVNFLMEEEEEPENEDIQLSDENQEIIREMDSQEAQKARKKTQKKAQKKEKKKEKQKKEKKPKAAKPAKPRKAKKPAEPDPYPVRKLGFKRVFPIVLLGFSVGAALFIFSYLSADYTNKQAAKKAYAEEDYQTCYVNLYGKKRNETEEQMYQKSECILHIRMWYREYELLASQESELKALDSLIQSVYEYPALLEYAFRWEAEDEVGAVYTDILNILYEKYGVTEMQAKEIASLESDIEYTRAVMDIAAAAGYGEAEEFGGMQSGQVSDTQATDGASGEIQPDELPEEAGLESEEFEGES